MLAEVVSGSRVASCIFRKPYFTWGPRRKKTGRERKCYNNIIETTITIT